jgi:hypothetical protein
MPQAADADHADPGPISLRPARASQRGPSATGRAPASHGLFVAGSGNRLCGLSTVSDGLTEPDFRQGSGLGEVR